MRHPRSPPIDRGDEAIIAPLGAIGEHVALGRGRQGHVVERIDLSVRVRDGRSYFGTAVLEHQDVRDVGARAERGAPLRPKVHDLARPDDTERRERRLVVGCVQHDFAPRIRHRGETVDE